MPAAPTGLKVASFSSTAVSLTWDAMEGATFNVYRSQAVQGGFGAYVKVNPSALGSPAFTDNAGSLVPPAAGQTYLYRVTATVSAVESALSTAVSAAFLTPAQRVTAFHEDDLDIIFAEDQAIDATYTQFGFSPVAIRVIYDRKTEEFEKFGEKEQKHSPAVRAKTKDVPNITNKDTLAIAGITYYVVNPKDDGWGVTHIDLSLRPV